MTTGIGTTTDFQGLAQLRSRAAQSAPEATREAARQFEALFVQMMLKSMREANAVLGEQRDSTYEEMFDRQISLEMTRDRGLGLADMLVRQLGGAPASAPAPTGLPEPVPGWPPVQRHDFRPADREDFVRQVWPHAVAAGRSLGVDPRAILAQAALESGWGQRQIRDGAGVSGNNLFGIKADRSWTGDRLTVTTLEYADGIPRPERAQFRAYGSLAEGFADYVRFLADNPRYTDALRSGADPHDYALRLQEAGYATDPRYADKLRDIIDSPVLQQTAQALKTGTGVPM